MSLPNALDHTPETRITTHLFSCPSKNKLHSSECISPNLEMQKKKKHTKINNTKSSQEKVQSQNTLQKQNFHGTLFFPREGEEFKKKEWQMLTTSLGAPLEGTQYGEVYSISIYGERNGMQMPESIAFESKRWHISSIVRWQSDQSKAERSKIRNLSYNQPAKCKNCNCTA